MPETEPGRPDYEAIARIKQDATPRLLAVPGVTAVALGAKVVAGRPTDTPSIKVFVRDKRPAAKVPPDELIPADIDGVPTDVETGGDLTPLAGPPTGVLNATRLNPDSKTYRPVIGGGTLTTAGSSASGTLGCLLWDAANHEVGYALTNQHVAHAPDIRTMEKDRTEIGQPDGEHLSENCCNDIIGVWAGGDKNADRDEAVVRLSPGMKWKAEIAGIGRVAGIHELTREEGNSKSYQVRKRGSVTRLTGGFISGFTATTHETQNLIIITPNPHPDAGPRDTTFFAYDGDSGSVLVNDANEVVGLLHHKDGGGRGWATPITHVLARLAEHEKLDLQVAVSPPDVPIQVHTVPGGPTVAVPREVAEQVAADPAMRGTFQGSGDRAPLGRPWFTDVPPPAATLTHVRADLDRSSAGRLLGALWGTHRTELTRLVTSDRRVMIVWHRGGGAALVQLLLRMLAHPDRTLPETLNGEPLMTCLDRLHSQLAQYASPALRTDLDRARAVLPDLAGLSYQGIVDALADVSQRNADQQGADQ
ncbi:hypothetical protein OHA02_01335 [Streptomyces phaeochromogenes]|nr:hypothetical protein [Streptomyces phaeochromogenes]